MHKLDVDGCPSCTSSCPFFLCPLTGKADCLGYFGSVSFENFFVKYYVVVYTNVVLLCVAVVARIVSRVEIVDRLPEAEAALAKSEKVLSELSGMLLVVNDDIEGWTIKLSLAIGRFAFVVAWYSGSIVCRINKVTLH